VFTRHLITGGAAVSLLIGKPFSLCDVRERPADFDPETDVSLLRKFLAVGEDDTGVLRPACDYQGKPLPPSGWYEIEEKCCKVFNGRFNHPLDQKLRVRRVERLWDKLEDSYYVFGSQITNLISRLILGKPSPLKPILEIVQPNWRAELEWNFHSPLDAAECIRTQYEQQWKFKNHRIVSRGKMEVSGGIFESKYSAGRR
jgi:hypothetical protein